MVTQGNVNNTAPKASVFFVALKKLVLCILRYVLHPFDDKTCLKSNVYWSVWSAIALYGMGASDHYGTPSAAHFTGTNEPLTVRLQDV